jgi:hypothetical protein
MNLSGQELHLIVNHVPVIGAFWVLLLALVAWFKPDPVLIRTALVFTVLVGVSVVPAFLTGDGAEEVVEHLPGVSEPAIGRHEEMADKALWITVAAGVIALATLAIRTGRPLTRRVLLPSLIVLAVAAGTLAWTAHLGGMIHRPELRQGSGAVSPEAGEHG